MASERTIDEIDASILDILQYNARTTQAELAKAVDLAPSAILERLRKLESRGIIKDYVALIDPHVVERGMLAFVAVRTSEHGPDMPSAYELSRIPEVLEVHHVAGDAAPEESHRPPAREDADAGGELAQANGAHERVLARVVPDPRQPRHRAWRRDLREAKPDAEPPEALGERFGRGRRSCRRATACPVGFLPFGHFPRALLRRAGP